MLGVAPNAPLKSGQALTVQSVPGINFSGSGEGQLISKYFQQSSEAEQYANELLKASQDQINKETAWVDKYLKDNPFVFDEELAKASATQEYQPYYSELLNDYLSDVNVQRESTQDEQKLLRQLRTLDVGSRSRAREYAIENAEKGWEGKGLFGSGMRARDVGKQEVGYKQGMEEATAKYQTNEADINRTLEGYDISSERKARDIGRSQDVAITGGIEQRRGEQIKPYLATYEQAYKRQFQPSTMSATDYLPAEYLRY